MKLPSKRIKILTANEIEDLYGLPSFTNEERFKYFTLDSLEEEALKNLRSITSKIVFIYCATIILAGDDNYPVRLKV